MHCMSVLCFHSATYSTVFSTDYNMKSYAVHPDEGLDPTTDPIFRKYKAVLHDFYVFHLFRPCVLAVDLSLVIYYT